MHSDRALPAMSVSPKLQLARSAFSVHDILSPLDDNSALPRLKAAVAVCSSAPVPYVSSASASMSQSGDSPSAPDSHPSDSYLLLGSSASDPHSADSGLVHNKQMSVPVSTPFGVHVPQLGMSVAGHAAHHPSSHPHGGHPSSGSSAFTSGSQYVNGAAELSSAYGDVRAPPGPWYSSSTSDPRFATDYSTLSTGNSSASSIRQTFNRIEWPTRPSFDFDSFDN